MKDLNKTIAVLKKGGVIIVPTDTVYGFIADVTNKKAVEKIYKIKKRPKSKPLPIFVSGVKMAGEIAEVDQRALKMFKKYWPGPYTFVLKAKSYNLKAQKTIALRMPKDTFLLKLLKKYNKPLVQTSANISGQEPLKNAEQIMTTFGKSKLVGLIITSSKARAPSTGSGQARPSKIIDLTGKTLTRIR